jgi:hypothetical protein
MGCFNYVCCISGLPIEAGTLVRFLALTQTEWYRPNEHICYVTGRWQPRTAPLKARYNDYGSVEDVESDLTERVFWGSFKADVVEVGVGKNKCHDVAVRKEMQRGEWLEALWEGRVFVKAGCEEYNHGDRAVAQAMIREDVWQVLLNEHKFPAYAPDYSTQWLKIDELRTFACMVPEQEEWGSLSHYNPLPPSSWLGQHLQGHEGVSGFYLQDALLLAIELAESDEELREFAVELVELVHVQAAYSRLNGQWQPTSNAGQEGHWKEQRAFHRALAEIRGQWEDEHEG